MRLFLSGLLVLHLVCFVFSEVSLFVVLLLYALSLVTMIILHFLLLMIIFSVGVVHLSLL